MKWDRWQSTDKGRGREKEQKEKSSVMQTCDKKLQSEEKQQSPSAEGVSQQCRQCICASPRAENREEVPGETTQQPRGERVPRAQVQPQSLQLLGALSERSSRVRLEHSCLCALRGTRAPRAQAEGAGWQNSTETASPQNTPKSHILQGKEKVKRQTTERRRLA